MVHTSIAWFVMGWPTSSVLSEDDLNHSRHNSMHLLYLVLIYYRILKGWFKGRNTALLAQDQNKLV